MPKKDYKRKSSKALTKQRKQLKKPEDQETIENMNRSPGVWNKKKKR